MMNRLDDKGFRRNSPRIEVETLCSEFQGGLMSHAIVTDIGIEGLCIERPFGLQRGRTIPIEFEIPEVDEIFWAVGEVRFDEVKRPTRGAGGLGGLIRYTGLRLVHAAERHRRILREYVMDYRNVADELDPDDTNWLMMASCYR